MAGTAQETVHGYEEQSINLLDVLVRLIAKWRTFLITFFLSFALCVVLIYRIQPLYEANISILPSTAAEEANSLSSLFTGRHSGDIYVGLLHSRAVIDNVIRRMDLRRVYGTGSLDATRGLLGHNTKIGVGPDSILGLTVRDADATLAMRIANSYLDALQDQQIAMASSASEQRQQFYAKQLQREKDALVAAEEDLLKTQQALGLVQVGQQTSIGLSAIADLRAQITGLQVRLSSLLLSETEQNPEVKSLRTQIAQLQGQERSLSAGKGGGPAGAALPAGEMAAANLEYARKEREVQYHTALFSSLSHELENARLSQAAASQTFQVVDRAVVPEFRAYPDRKTLLLLALAASLFFGVLAVAIHILVERIVRDPDNQRSLQALQQQFRPGR